MKSLIALISLFTLTAAADSRLEFTSRYEAALRLIEARNKGDKALICQNSADQSTITELVARSIADDPAGLTEFYNRIPHYSDILKNLEFRALVTNTDLLGLSDAKQLEKLLVNTRYFSRASVGGVGHAVKLDLLADGKVFVNGKYKGTWKTYIEIEPGADYYQFVDVIINGKRWLYLLGREANGLLVLKSAKQPDDIYGVFLLEPSDCAL